MTTEARHPQPIADQDDSTKHSPYTVFVSHSSDDLFIAERIVAMIEALGGDCRIDKQNFEAGGAIWDEINKAVGESQEAIILFTPNSRNADWVIFEVGAASQQKIRITPIIYSVDYKELKIIAGKIAVDLNKDFNKYLVDLKKRIDAWKP